MITITNAFSLAMLPLWRQSIVGEDGDPAFVTELAITPCDPVAVLAKADAEGRDVSSAVGHADTAALFAGILGRPVPSDRRSISLGCDEALLVGQYVGPRLPAGATTLPACATVRWFLVQYLEDA
jgi:hypothetical protein